MREGWFGRLLTHGATALVLVFLIAPLIVAIMLSFAPTELLAFPPRGFSLRWYADFFTAGRWTLATWNSLVVATATMVLSTLLGAMAAVGLHLGRFPGQGLLLVLLSMPVVTPHIVTAAAMFFAFSIVGLTNSLPGVVLAHTVIAVPFVVLTVSAALRGFDAALLRAAASLGASPPLAVWRVVVPMVWPGIAAGAVFAFATSLDELVVTLFMAGPGQFTLPVQMYATVREYTTPTLLAASSFLFLCSLVLLLANEVLRRRHI